MQSTPPPFDLKVLRPALHELHRLLLNTLKKDRERIVGKVLAPAEWFQILIGAPEYQWMKPFNSLLSDVDALAENESASSVDLAVLQYELEFLFFKENGDVTSFNFHYRQLFANHHEVMYSHGHLRQAFVSLPPSGLVPGAEEIRRGWHKISASQRKRLN